ncbi:cupin domain-containing protein [Streptomyces sp. NPDC000963]
MDASEPAHRAPGPLREPMEPHPEGGRFRQIWTSEQSVTPLDGRSARPAATAIQYLLEPGEKAEWHQVGSDELWIWQNGGPAHLLTAPFPPDAPDHRPTAHLLGPPDPSEDGAGIPPSRQDTHHLVPAGLWQSTRLLSSAYALFLCVVAPGFDTRDYTLLRPGAAHVEARIHRIVNRPAEAVWEDIEAFTAIASWHPAITHSAPGPTGPRTRKLLTADGQDITEELLLSDRHQKVQEYTFVHHPFPVTDYRARIEVQALGPDRCEVHWSARFHPTEGDGDAERAMFENDIFHPGLHALESSTEPTGRQTKET